MPFQRIDSEKLSKSVVRQVEQLILRGILRPGERLPSERELAEKLAVSRPSLREALSELQQAGLLTGTRRCRDFCSRGFGLCLLPRPHAVVFNP
jgi:GntR family transcriptional repressor for pyruvate dehydrogenase complex